MSTPPGPLYLRPCLEQSWKTTVEKADTNKKCIQEKGQGRARAHRRHNGVKNFYEVSGDIRNPFKKKNCYWPKDAPIFRKIVHCLVRASVTFSGHKM